MRPTSLPVVLLLALLLSSAATETAVAQPRGYVSGAVFADIRDFSEATGTFSEEWSLDTTGIGGGVRVATFVHPRWTIELGFDAGSRTTAEFEEDVRILIFPAPPPFRIERSTRFTSVTAMAGYHPAPIGRLRLGYLVGYSFVRANAKFEYPGLDLSRFGVTVGTVPGDLPFEIIVPRTSVVLPRTAFESTTTSGAITLGFEAAYQMTSRLSIVPEIRALALTSPDALLIRPGLSVRWQF